MSNINIITKWLLNTFVVLTAIFLSSPALAATDIFSQPFQNAQSYFPQNFASSQFPSSELNTGFQNPNQASVATGTSLFDPNLFVGQFAQSANPTSSNLQIKEFYPDKNAFVFVCNVDGPDFHPTKFNWDFGDSQKLVDVQNKDVYHDYDNNGNYQVSCSGTDGVTVRSGALTTSAFDSNKLGQVGTQVNNPFIGQFAQNSNLNINGYFPQQNAFSFACNLGDSSFQPIQYKWSFGDGNTYANTDSNNIFHTFNQGGDYVTACTATDGIRTRIARIKVSVLTMDRVDNPYAGALGYGAPYTSPTYVTPQPGYVTPGYPGAYPGAYPVGAYPAAGGYGAAPYASPYGGVSPYGGSPYIAGAPYGYSDPYSNPVLYGSQGTPSAAGYAPNGYPPYGSSAVPYNGMPGSGGYGSQPLPYNIINDFGANGLNAPVNPGLITNGVGAYGGGGYGGYPTSYGGYGAQQYPQQYPQGYGYGGQGMAPGAATYPAGYQQGAGVGSAVDQMNVAMGNPQSAPAATVDPDDPNTITISGMQFAPKTLKIKHGTTVTWINGDNRPHTVTATDASFDSSLLNVGQSYSHTFDEKGTFDYICTIHPSMSGRITVT